MPSEPGRHKISERCLAHSPRSRQPWQCKHCGQLFRTKNSALDHECSSMIEKESGSFLEPNRPEPSPSPTTTGA